MRFTTVASKAVAHFLPWTSHTNLQISKLICGVIPLLPILQEGVSSSPAGPGHDLGLLFLLTWCWNAAFGSPLLPRQPSPRCLWGKCSPCRPRGANNRECALCITQQSKQRQRNRLDLSTDWQERALLLAQSMIYTPLQGWRGPNWLLSEAEDIFIPADLSASSFHLSVTQLKNYQPVRSRMGRLGAAHGGKYSYLALLCKQVKMADNSCIKSQVGVSMSMSVLPACNSPKAVYTISCTHLNEAS